MIGFGPTRELIKNECEQQFKIKKITEVEEQMNNFLEIND